MQKFKFFTLAILAMLSVNLWSADLKVGDYLIKETFKGGANSTTFSAKTYGTTYSSITWSTGNSGDASSISYASENAGFYNPTSAPANMTTDHVWLNKNTAGYIQINNIPLHNVTKFKAHWASNNADATFYFKYKFNGESSWSDGGSKKAKSADNQGTEITVPSGKTSVSIQFSRENNGKNNRIDDIKLEVLAVSPSCTAPTITKDLSETEVVYTKGATATALSITATGTDVTYQWYSNTSKSTTGATTLTGQTSASYTPSTATTGTTYYYCVASSSTCTTTSKFAKITVNEPSYTITATKNDASLGNVSLSGKVITATPNACVGYANSAYTVSPAGKATVAQNGNTFTVSNVTDNVTVTINFVALTPDTYEDHLHGNTAFEECGSYTAPSLDDATKATEGNCDAVHYHFAGWVIDPIFTGTPGTPDDMITAGTAMTSNGRTYIAVWAKEQ